LADSAPVAPNDSAANRARNRRVTIILRSSP
jgi:flagellar motor protein MotB